VLRVQLAYEFLLKLITRLFKSQLYRLNSSFLQSESPKKLSPCDVAALEKCLKENNGDHKKVN
jgi:hypothetical protein